jgi:hypothetical protein
LEAELNNLEDEGDFDNIQVVFSDEEEELDPRQRDEW